MFLIVVIVLSWMTFGEGVYRILCDVWGPPPTAETFSHLCCLFAGPIAGIIGIAITIGERNSHR